jgi:anti-sigma regulatory factor (Ser/Thr protein kinase)
MHSPTRQKPPLLASFGSLYFSQAYLKEPESVSSARVRFRGAAVEGKLDEDLRLSAELCLTELAANAVRHAHDSRTIKQILVQVAVRRIQNRPYLEISVWDVDWHRMPPLPNPDTAEGQLFGMTDEDIGGRGLLLVASLAEDIGYDRFPRHGKRIWCRWAL